MNALKAAIELNLTPTKQDFGHWEVLHDSNGFTELSADLIEQCPDCHAHYDITVTIFKNEGEGWGVTIGSDTNELGERNYLSSQVAFMSLLEELNLRGHHEGCA